MGKKFYKKNLEIDRKRLAEIIFFDKIERDKLNKLTNEYVVKKIIDMISQNEISVIDVPLLFECGLNMICTKTIRVSADYDICIKRIMERDNIDKKTAVARIESQKDNNVCDYNITNNNDTQDLKIQIKNIFK